MSTHDLQQPGLARALRFRGAFDAKRRRACIEAGADLPPAMRVPTELSLWWHIKETLDVAEHLEAALAYQQEHPDRMRKAADHVICQLVKLYPEPKQKRMIRRVANAVFIGGNPEDFYGLERVADRCTRMDYDDCCARRAGLGAPRRHGIGRAASAGPRHRDHYTWTHHGQLFLPYIVYKYLCHLRRKEKLPPVAPTSKCSVCQYRAARRAAEGGAPVRWRQAEPCRCARAPGPLVVYGRAGVRARLRHWSCDECTEQRIARGEAATCALCREPVLCYEAGRAPAANQ